MNRRAGPGPSSPSSPRATAFASTPWPWRPPCAPTPTATATTPRRGNGGHAPRLRLRDAPPRAAPPDEGRARYSARGVDPGSSSTPSSPTRTIPACPRVSLLDARSTRATSWPASCTRAPSCGPGKVITGLEAASVRKKLKDKGFARTVNRDDVYRGAEELGVDLDEHIAFVIAALSTVASEVGLPRADRPRFPFRAGTTAPVLSSVEALVSYSQPCLAPRRLPLALVAVVVPIGAQESRLLPTALGLYGRARWRCQSRLQPMATARAGVADAANLPHRDRRGHRPARPRRKPSVAKSRSATRGAAGTGSRREQTKGFRAQRYACEQQTAQFDEMLRAQAATPPARPDAGGPDRYPSRPDQQEASGGAGARAGAWSARSRPRCS